MPKLILAFALFAISYLLLASPAGGFAINTVHAQVSVTTVGAPPSVGQFAPNLNPNVPRDQHSYVQTVMIETMSALICQLSGIDMVRGDHKCLGVDQGTGKIGFVEGGGGAIGVIGTFIAYTFTPPVSSGDYVRYLSGNFGITKKAYAQNTCTRDINNRQGVGFCGIQPLLKVWVSMRNIAYLLFVLIFVIIGLAIMLRVHIDPRTVMSIENQIPRIIVGILLVTFSFAIAGFLIDVMYVAIYLVGGVLFPLIKDVNPDSDFAGNLNSIATAATPFDAIASLWGGVWGGLGGLSDQGKNTISTLITNVLGGQGVNNTTPDLVALATGGFTAIVGLIVGLLAFLIIFIALIYTAIRLWIILIVAYISVLLDVVFAPFWFLIGLFPGSSLGVGAWFKDMLANLAVFPTAIAMFILAKVFSEIALVNYSSGTLFVPPLAGGGTLDDATVFSGIVALGFLFMTPHVLQITRNAIKAPAINYGPVFQPAGAAGGTLRAGAQLVAAGHYDPLAGQPGEGARRKARIAGRLFGI